LHFERHEPGHPVAQAAEKRIEELALEKAKVQSEVRQLEAAEPDRAAPSDIEATLEAIPDLRGALAAASPEELAEIFDAFEIKAFYDKRDHSLAIEATVIPELWAEDDSPEPERPAVAGRRSSFIAGALCGRNPLSWGASEIAGVSRWAA
jgi:hypothetical protein